MFGSLPRFHQRYFSGGLSRDAGLLLASQCFCKASGALILVILARRLSADAIGQFMFVVAVAQAFPTIGNLRLDIVVMRRVAADPSQAGSLLAGLLGLRLASGVPFLISMVIACMVMGGSGWPMALGVGLFMLLDDIYACFATLLIGLGKSWAHAIVTTAVEIVYLILFSSVMWWSPSPTVLVGGNLFRASLLVVMAGLFTHRTLGALHVGWNSGLIKEGLPFAGLSLMMALRGRLDTLLLGVLAGHHAVGLFSLAFRVVLATQFVPLTLSRLMIPKLARDGFDRNNRRTAAQILTLLASIGLLGTGIAVTLSGPITTFFCGPLARLVAPVLEGLAWLIPLSFLNQFLIDALQGLNEQKRLIRINSVLFLVAVPLTWIMVAWFGLQGAVVARIANAVLMTLAIGWCVAFLAWRTRKAGNENGQASFDLGRHSHVQPSRTIERLPGGAG